MDKQLTVFTPTYNRAYTLIYSYRSLCNQTSKDFIWMIVDDGSTDNTSDLVDKWKEEGVVDIVYIYQHNAGKQRAVNTGIKNCTTPYFGFLDSDDYYCEDTVEKILNKFAMLDSKKVAGILARRGIDRKTPIGSKNIPKGHYIMNVDSLIKKYNYQADTCRAYFTNIIRNYLYPEIDDKFIPEDVMLSAIDQDYDMLIVNEVYSISGYLSDGYTKKGHKIFHSNKIGFALGMAQLSISNRGLLRRMKYTVMFTVWCLCKKISGPDKLLKKKHLYYMLYPLSVLALLFKWPNWYFNEG